MSGEVLALAQESKNPTLDMGNNPAPSAALARTPFRIEERLSSQGAILVLEWLENHVVFVNCVPQGSARCNRCPTDLPQTMIALLGFLQLKVW